MSAAASRAALPGSRTARPGLARPGAGFRALAAGTNATGALTLSGTGIAMGRATPALGTVTLGGSGAATTPSVARTATGVLTLAGTATPYTGVATAPATVIGTITLTAVAQAFAAPPPFMANSGFPTLKYEIAFGQGPRGLVPANGWTDISRYVQPGWSSSRGRDFELNRITAGTTTLRLRNVDGRFDPLNTAGPYFGSLKPLRPVRISAVWQGVTYYLFQGNVLAWPQTWRLDGRYGEVILDMSDALTLLAGYEFPLAADPGAVGFPAQRTDQRINAILDFIGWPLERRAIEAGTVNVIRTQTELGGTTALEQIQLMADTDLGAVFTDTYGDIVFHAASHRYAVRAPKVVFGERTDLGEIPYGQDVRVDYDERLIYNDIAVTQGSATDGPTTVGRAMDQTSVDSYFKRTLNKTFPIASGRELQDTANELLARYQEPHARIEPLTVNPAANPSLFAVALGVEIGDYVRFNRRPPYAPMITVEGYVEKITQTTGRNLWTTTFLLTPRPPLRARYSLTSAIVTTYAARLAKWPTYNDASRYGGPTYSVTRSVLSPDTYAARRTAFPAYRNATAYNA